MAFLIKAFMDWLRSLFFKEEMELTLVGLQNSGKTTLVNVLAVRAAIRGHACGRGARWSRSWAARVQAQGTTGTHQLLFLPYLAEWPV